jgi:hypothetical protein
MKVTKINLEDFRNTELEITELLENKGGSGVTNTSTYHTSSHGSDHDNTQWDSDS